jgi:signal transduction histidine kinase
MVPALEPNALAQLRHETPQPDPQSQIGREVAHELNNILTIIQGYSDRLILKNPGNAALLHDLQLISDNSRRAVAVIRKSRIPIPTSAPANPAGPVPAAA